VKIARKYRRITKEIPYKPVRGVQTLYMTGRMRNHGNQVTEGRRGALAGVVG
jgi:hypothetical protein